MEKESSLQKRNFMLFSKKIEEIKEPIWSALAWILSYKKAWESDNNISTKFFNENIKEVSKQDIENAQIFLEHFENQFKRLKIDLINEESFNETQKKTLLQIINSNILKIILLKESVFIEAEKWWYRLSIAEKNERLQKIEKLETMIYWPKISDQIKEKKIIMTYLDNLHKNNVDKLNPEENQIFEWFLNKFSERNIIENKKNSEEQSEKIDSMWFCQILKKVFDIYNIKNKLVIIDNNRDTVSEENDIIYIPWSIDEKMREKILEDNWLKDTMKITIDPKVSSISAWENKISIPESYKNLSIKRICELIDHEISTHILTNKNNKKTLNIKTDTYLELQEWVAVLNEKLATEKMENLNINEPTIHHISTFIGENYNGEESKKILEIYYKMLWDVDYAKKANDRVMRIKRFHSFDLPWANRKDVVYRRWLADVVLYINSLDKNSIEDRKKLQADIYKFYISKLWKNEITNADKLIEWFDIDKWDVILPFALWKIIYEKLLWNNISNIDDIRFLASEHKLNYKQMKILLEIVQLIKENQTK